MPTSGCKHRAFIPVTPDVIECHLRGEDRVRPNGRGGPFVADIYPLLFDDTCSFLAVDFGDESWIEDAQAFIATCREVDVPTALERSRSGNGGHVWLFFSEPVAASEARHLGTLLLTRTMNWRSEIGFKSYDRLFPSQDAMAAGGFGNLIALPLQRQARESGNSMFIDDELRPHEDQWAYLSSLPRLSSPQVAALEPHAYGMLAATTAFGKTVVGARMIAAHGVNTLVLVHRRQLVDQWRERLRTFLSVEEKDIGTIGGGKRKPSGKIDVALIQSLVRNGEVSDVVADYGHLIVDECHHRKRPVTAALCQG